jgi:hypothetical protein
VPDLGAIRRASGRGRRGRAEPVQPAHSGSAVRSLRRSAMSVLAAGERRAATRPAAHLARLAWVELRGAVRRTA